MTYQVEEVEIEGLKIITPPVFQDDRGYFFETYKKSVFEEIGIPAQFLQDNESCSKKNVLRGLHFQKPPFDQGKLVRVIKGAVLDVAVDIRKNSPTFGKYFSVLLSEKNKKMFWIPPGFAHGFLSLEEDTIFSYKCTNVYDKESEGAVLWNDPAINIQWNVQQPIVSEKDAAAPLLQDFQSPF